MLAERVAKVRKCEACAKTKCTTIKGESHAVVDPLETVAIGILGTFPKSKRRFLLILVITDCFTKLTQIVPHKRINASDVAVAIIEECVMLSVKNSFTKTFHPQTNGQAKQFNRSLTAMSRCYVEDHSTDWSRFACSFCYAYRNAVHHTTGTTPIPLVLRRPSPESSIFKYEHRTPMSEMMDNFKKRFEVTLGKAKTSPEASQARDMKDFDKKVLRARKLGVGKSVNLDTIDWPPKEEQVVALSGRSIPTFQGRQEQPGEH